MKQKQKLKKKKRICIVTWYNCLRCIKLSIGLWLQKDRYGQEYEIELITRREGYSLITEMDFSHIYKSIRIFENPSQLMAALKDSKADIFWCHNEPDLMAQLAIHMYKGKRMIIHDCHDLPSLHYKAEQCKACGIVNNRIMTEFVPQEKFVCQNADYVFVPTPDYISMIQQKYGRDKGVLQVNVCAPSIFFPDYDLPRVGGFMYCGQVNVPEMKSELRYRDCLPLFQVLAQLGVPAHIYNTTPLANLEPYLLNGAVLHGTLKMFAAIQQYTRYDYGFTGSNVNCQEIQVCMPNKLFDNIAAGIPVICLNAKTAGDFVMKHDIGISVQGFENLHKVPWIRNENGHLKNWDFWEAKRQNVRKIRHEFTAEKEVRKAFDAIGI